MKGLSDLGFRKNTQIINGRKPHFAKGKDLLFLIGKDYWISKIASINRAFQNYDGKVYGILTGEEPSCAKYDWVTFSNVTLLKIKPLSEARWRADGKDIEFIPTTL